MTAAPHAIATALTRYSYAHDRAIDLRNAAAALLAAEYGTRAALSSARDKVIRWLLDASPAAERAAHDDYLDARARIASEGLPARAVVVGYTNARRNRCRRFAALLRCAFPAHDAAADAARDTDDGDECEDGVADAEGEGGAAAPFASAPGAAARAAARCGGAGGGAAAVEASERAAAALATAAAQKEMGWEAGGAVFARPKRAAAAATAAAAAAARPACSAAAVLRRKDPTLTLLKRARGGCGCAQRGLTLSEIAETFRDAAGAASARDGEVTAWVGSHAVVLYGVPAAPGARRGLARALARCAMEYIARYK